ncbi:MAG: hypothetical protein QXL15_04480 [Candidatus Korarchaeota archaeon]
MIIKDVWLMHSGGALLQTLSHKYAGEVQLFTSFLSAFNSIVANMRGSLSSVVISEVKFSFASRGELIYILLSTTDIPSSYTTYVVNFIADRYHKIAGNKEFIGDTSLYNDFDDIAQQALRDSGILFLNSALQLFESAQDIHCVCLVEMKEKRPLILKIRKDIDEDLIQRLSNVFRMTAPARFLIAVKKEYYIISGTPEWGIVLVMNPLERYVMSTRLNLLKNNMPEATPAPTHEEVKLIEDWRA